jgi:hypothetical protein
MQKDKRFAPSVHFYSLFICHTDYLMFILYLSHMSPTKEGEVEQAHTFIPQPIDHYVQKRATTFVESHIWIWIMVCRDLYVVVN